MAKRFQKCSGVGFRGGVYAAPQKGGDTVETDAVRCPICAKLISRAKDIHNGQGTVPSHGTFGKATQ